MKIGERPKLAGDIEDRIKSEFVDVALAAKVAQDGRNELLRVSADQTYRVSAPSAGMDRWPDACDLVHPLTFQVLLRLEAQVRAVQRQRPFVIAQAQDSEDMEAATRLEQWIDDCVHRDGIDAAEAQALRICLRDACCPVHFDWSQTLKRIRGTGYFSTRPIPLADGTELPEGSGPYDESQVGVDNPDYEMRPTITWEPDKEGIRATPLDLANFWLDPPTAKSVNEASGCGHSEWMTPYDLLDAIETSDFDKETTEEVVRMSIDAPADSTDYREGQDAIEGVVESGTIEVMYWYGRCPLWLEAGEIATPKQLRDEDFCAVIVPKFRRVLKWGYYPRPRRPYELMWFYQEPGRNNGESVPTVVGPYQDEATARTRAMIDALDLIMSPMFTGPEELQNKLGNIYSAPGRFIGLRPGQVLNPIQWDASSVMEGTANVQQLSQIGESVLSGTVVEPQPKVRKAAEINTSAAFLNTKYDLLLENIMAWREGVAHQIIMLRSEHMADEGDQFLTSDGQTQTITAEDTKRKFSFYFRGSSQDVDPQAKLDRTMFKQQITRASILFQQLLKAGDLRPEWELMMEAFSALDVRNGESLIGPKPPAPDIVQSAAKGLALVSSQAATQAATQAVAQVAQQFGMPPPQQPIAANVPPEAFMQMLPTIIGFIVQALRQGENSGQKQLGPQPTEGLDQDQGQLVGQEVGVV